MTRIKLFLPALTFKSTNAVHVRVLWCCVSGSWTPVFLTNYLMLHFWNARLQYLIESALYAQAIKWKRIEFFFFFCTIFVCVCVWINFYLCTIFFLFVRLSISFSICLLIWVSLPISSFVYLSSYLPYLSLFPSISLLIVSQPPQLRPLVLVFLLSTTYLPLHLSSDLWFNLYINSTISPWIYIYIFLQISLQLSISIYLSLFFFPTCISISFSPSPSPALCCISFQTQ